MASKTVYVCEKSGNDDHHTGLNPEEALCSALRALELYNETTPELTILIKKEGEEQFVPLAASALKKAKKKYDIDRSKASKEATKKETIAQANMLKEAEELKRLEEAKSIVLVEDSSLPLAKKVRLPLCLAH
jgi:asparaginyl-tRNA synthetase